MTRILGIDPGLNTTGYGVVDFDGVNFHMVEAGIVRSRAKGTIQSRVNEIFSGVREVIEDHHPDLLSLEQLFSHYSRPVRARRGSPGTYQSQKSHDRQRASTEITDTACRQNAIATRQRSRTGGRCRCAGDRDLWSSIGRGQRVKKTF